MSRVKFPVTIVQILKTCLKFFARYKADGKESPLNVATQFDYNALGDIQFAEFVTLNEEIDAMRASIRQKVERRERLWDEILKPAVMAGKNVLMSINTKTPSALTDYGFILVTTPSEPPVQSVKTLTTKATNLQSEIDAFNALNEKTMSALPNLSITVNEVTKTTKVKG
jgi:hypothetical protein